MPMWSGFLGDGSFAKDDCCWWFTDIGIDDDGGGVDLVDPGDWREHSVWCF